MHIIVCKQPVWKMVGHNYVAFCVLLLVMPPSMVCPQWHELHGAEGSAF